MKVHRMQQGTPEWFAVRAGICTASEMGVLVTPKEMEVSKSKGVETYVAKKIAEKWLGRPLEDPATSFDMEQGKILEDHAIPWFELEYGVSLDRVGFITTDDGSAGCSPDGLCPTTGVEIKCPKAHTHVQYLRDGVLPTDYIGQVQSSLYVTGMDKWTFVSYCRGFPQFVLEVGRNEKYLAAMAKAVELFNAKLTEGYELLLKLNGGPPLRETERDLIGEFYDQAPVNEEDAKRFADWIESDQQERRVTL